MKNKIAMWCMLFALLVALVPPSSARANTTETTADDVKYTDIEDFMNGKGYTDFIKTEGNYYLCVRNGDYYYIVELANVVNPYFATEVADLTKAIYLFSDSSPSVAEYKTYKYYTPAKASLYDNYACLGTATGMNATPLSSRYVYYMDWSKIHWSYLWAVNEVLYSDLDIYQATYESSDRYYKSYDNVLFESSIVGGYTFPSWCADANLNCLASTNESASKIPYSYNGYYHIVRKTSAGKWLLTTIGNSLGQKDVQVRFTEDNGALMLYNSYSGEDINGYMVNVRQYEYDTDGWKVRTYETFDSREYENGTIELGAGTGVDSTRVMAYTNTDIYSYNGYAIAQSASTEYIEVGGSTDTGGGSDSGDSETEEPTVTPVPTTAPSGGDTSDGSGSGSEGGGTGGGTRPEGGTEDDGTLLENINSMVEMISAVPQIIKAVFSFLPAWCLTLVGIGFAIIVVIMVRRGTIG